MLSISFCSFVPLWQITNNVFASVWRVLSPTFMIPFLDPVCTLTTDSMIYDSKEADLFFISKLFYFSDSIEFAASVAALALLII